MSSAVSASIDWFCEAALTPAFATGKRLIDRELSRAAIVAAATSTAAALVVALRLAAGGRLLAASTGGVGGGCGRRLDRRRIGRRRRLLRSVPARVFLGLADRVFLFLGLQCLFAFAFFAFLGLGLGLSALALLLALAFFRGASLLVLGLAGLGGLQCLETALKLGVGDTVVTLSTLGGLLRGRLHAGLGDHDALALGFHDDTLGAPAGKALVHASAAGTARQT